MTMFETVFIVDDEWLVRKTLVRMIESNDIGWKVIGEASNGIEALDMLNNMTPDLIMTDIRMPKMDGLQLAEQLYMQEQDTKVIILTGYKDFEYAQTALKFGVVDFLLKPSSEQKVCEALNKVGQMIRKQKQSEQAKQRLQDETAIRTLFYRLPVELAVIRSIEQKYVRTDLSFVRVHDFFPSEKSYHSNELNLLQFAIHNIMQELLDTHLESGMIVPIFFDVYVLFMGKPKGEEKPVEQWRELFFEHLVLRVEQLLGIVIQVQYAGTVNHLREIPDLYEEMHQEFVFRKHQRGEEMSFFQEHAYYSAKIENLESQFISYMLVGNLRLLEESIRNLTQNIADGSCNEGKFEALVLVIALDRIIGKQFGNALVRFDIGAELSKLFSFQNMGEITSWVEHWIAALIAEIVKWSDEGNQNTIHRAIRYIEQNYMNKCSLQDVASHVFLNYKYFGNLFKNETGESFINYVTRVRLEKAVLLLGNTNLNVAQIAKLCGYDDPNYFTTLFRRKHNITPNEYRKQNK